jgi:hypothetical protein
MSPCFRGDLQSMYNFSTLLIIFSFRNTFLLTERREPRNLLQFFFLDKRHPSYPTTHSSPTFLCAKSATKCLHESSVRPLPKAPTPLYMSRITRETPGHGCHILPLIPFPFDAHTQTKNQDTSVDTAIKKGGYIQYLLDCNATCPSSPSLSYTSHHGSRPRAHAHPHVALLSRVLV